MQIEINTAVNVLKALPISIQQEIVTRRNKGLRIVLNHIIKIFKNVFNVLMVIKLLIIIKENV